MSTKEDVNILTIDTKIRQAFEDDKNNLENYKSRLKELLLTKKSGKLSIKNRKEIENNIAELSKKISEIESGEKLNYHLGETAEIVEEFRIMLKTPMKLSFMGKDKTESKKKKQLAEKYISIVSAYFNISGFDIDEKKSGICCPEHLLSGCECGNRTQFTDEENVSICLECGREYSILHYATSYKDIDRVNISTKYTYDRKVHFRDCINQYQGRQNCTIPQKVYDDLERVLENHHLLKGNKDSPKDIRFSNVTKQHILMFLKELKYSKHYENVTLIHYNMTGKKPDDISHLEDTLMNEFDLLVDTYDKHCKNTIERVNFISTQYVLYQLLQKHKHPCNKEDFDILKTVDRKSFHDEVCRDLFNIIGWNHTPTF